MKTTSRFPEQDIPAFLAAIPPVDAAATGALDTPRRARTSMSRRVMLRAALGLGGALALNILSWLPTPGSRSAWAHHSSTQHSNCAGYDFWEGYASGTTQLPCVGAPYGSFYCCGTGWFNNVTGTCYSAWLTTTTCGGHGFTKRNAWRWNFGGTMYRCSDGFVQTCGSSAQLRICSAAGY